MRGCVAGSLQYPHTGEQKEGEQKGMSERKECADRIKKISFMCLVCLIIYSSGAAQDES